MFSKSGKGSASYMGICKYKKSLHRRIDLKFYPREIIGTALLYFTGSANFNRMMRLYASKKGYSLSDKGLTYKPSYNSKKEIYVNEKLVTEESVFNFLGIEYMKPEERCL